MTGKQCKVGLMHAQRRGGGAQGDVTPGSLHDSLNNALFFTFLFWLSSQKLQICNSVFHLLSIFFA